MKPNAVHGIMAKHTIGDGEPIVIDRERSHGSWLVDAVTGRPFLDCASQFASQPLGWNHPALKAAASNLGAVAMHKYANSDYYSTDLASFVEHFSFITPHFKYKFFVEGGALAVENALKAAFDWKMKKNGWGEDRVNDLDVIHLKQAFHGRGGYSLSLTNTVPDKTALFPKFNWTRVLNPKIHFPMREDEVALLEVESVRQIEAALSTGRVAAIILEPIQSEGGDNHFRPEYLRTLRQLATANDALLIFDEVQTGIGLTGEMWAFQHFGVVPDMLCFGKKTQVCGFCSTTRIDEVPDNVFHTPSRINSTWGGNIVDMVRFLTIIRAIYDEDLVKNASKVGKYFLELLQTLPVSNVRGRGLLLAFDLETPEERNRVLNNMKEYMTALACGERSIRLRPHLTFNNYDAQQAVKYIAASVK